MDLDPFPLILALVALIGLDLTAFDRRRFPHRRSPARAGTPEPPGER